MAREENIAKVKVKYLRVPFSRAGHLSDHIFHAPGAKLWHYVAELCTLSPIYPLCGSALTNTTDNQSKMCPLKLTYFCLFLYHQSYTTYKGHLFPQWLSQVVMTGAQTCYPQMGEPAL